MTLQEIEEYFEHNPPPDSLDMGSYKIIDLPKMIESHLKYLRGNSGNRLFFQYYQRLIDVIQVLSKKDIVS